MHFRHAAPLAATAVAVTALIPGAVAGNERVAPSTQSVNDSSRIVAPTWKTFSTATGRGTRIVVSVGGNITAFTSPNQAGAQYEHIGVGSIGEGYVLCYTGAPATFDLGESSAGFAAPTTTATAITRNTLDGRASLTQKFSLTPGGTASPTTFNVTMTVKNRTGAPMTNVILRRQVDFDIDTGGAQGWAGFLSNHSRTKATVGAFHDPVEAPAGREAHGIMMMLQSPGGTWDTRVTANILDSSCNPPAAPLAANFVSRGDYGDTMIFNLGTIGAGASKSSSLRYMRY